MSGKARKLKHAPGASMYAKGGKWIQGALRPRTAPGGGKRGRGTLTAAAKAAGKSISEYCQSPPSGLARKRCNLRKTLMGLK